MRLIKLRKYGRDYLILKINPKEVKYTKDIFTLNPKNIYVLDTGVSEGIMTDGKKIVFVYQTVTCAYAIAGKLGYISVDKACKDGVMNYTVVDEIHFGRWKFRRGDYAKVDKFLKKIGWKRGGVTILRSYDLRGEYVR
jgi:hypothetical protein